MTPYDDIPLSDRDREILRVISVYLIAASDRARGSNTVPFESIEISKEDSHILADCLGALLRDERFLEKVKFSEAIIRPNAVNRKPVRNTFILRERFGHSRGKEDRISAWEQFYFDFGNMPFHEFLEIESKIFQAAELHPKVSYLLLRLLDEHKKYVEDPRHMKQLSKPGTIVRSFSKIRDQLDVAEDLFGKGAVLSNYSLAAIGTIVSDSTAFWVTRDYSTAGTISTLGAAALSLRKR